MSKKSTITESAPPMELASVMIDLHGSKRPFYYRQGTTDENIIRQIFEGQEYALGRLARMPELMKYLSDNLAKNKPPLVVDAGANIGASSVYFCHIDPSIHVVAIEPDQANYEILCKNSESRPIETLHGAVSSSSGKAQIITSGDGSWGSRTEKLPADSKKPGVPCVTINGIFAAHPGLTPFIVKIDIEGAEADVFSANTEWIEHTPIIIVELHDWMLPKGGSSLPFLKCISQHNRDFVYLGESIFSISNTI